MTSLRRALTALLVALLVALLASAGLVLVGAPAHACSCAMEGDRGALARADAVFVAEVLDRSIERGVATYDVEVLEVLKGEPGGTAEVLSSASGASCGLEGVVVGERRLFLVDGSRSPYAGNLCLGFGVTQGEAERILGAPEPAAADDPVVAGPADAGAVTDGDVVGVEVDDGLVWPWVAGGVLGLGLLVLVLRRLLVGSGR